MCVVPVHACTCVYVCVSVCLCVMCLRVSVASGGVRLILSCISTGAGLGHINILINMRESITEEARA